MYYSPSARGFYSEELHGDAMPPDVVPITAEAHAALLDAQAAGMVIVAGQGGAPEAQPRAPEPPIRTITPLAFRRRLSPARRVAVTAAAAQALAAGNAQLQTWLDDIAAARFVDLDDPELQAGVQALVAAQVLTAPEAALLLADGTPHEAA
jgi:hypothetical protein